MNKTKSSARMGGLIPAAVGVAVMASCSAYGQTTSPALPAPKDKSTPFSVDDTSVFMSRSVWITGKVAGNDAANQNTLNVNLFDHLTGTLWTDYHFGAGKVEQFDLDLTAHAKLAEVQGGLFKGIVTGGLGFQDWDYPTDLGGPHSDSILFSSISYNGPKTVNITLADRHLLNYGWGWHSDTVRLDVSRPFKILEARNCKFALTPSIYFCYNDNFKGDTGYRFIAPGITASLTWGNWTVGGFVKDQRNISSKVQSLTYYGIAISTSNLEKGFIQVVELLRK